MAKEYDTYGAMFKKIEKDMDRSLKKVSEHLVEVWKGLVMENFYKQYTPTKLYPRTFETLDAIMTMGFKDNTVYIGYDTSGIKEFTYGENNQYVGHSDINMQPSFVEDGFIMPDGSRREGAHAFESMLIYIKSKAFTNIFKEAMEKYGYSVVYK